MQNKQVMLSKGYYKHAQISGFVTVKNYIYVKRKGKKCLLLRFLNEADFEIEGLDFTVIQLDASGNVLGESRLRKEKLRFISGGYYTCHDAIVMREGCHDFKVIVNEAIAQDFRYCVRDGEVTAYYIKEREALFDLPKGTKVARNTEGFSVKTKRFVGSRMAVVLAVIMALIFLAMSVLRLVFPSGIKQNPKTSLNIGFAELTVGAEDSINNQIFGA